MLVCYAALSAVGSTFCVVSVPQTRWLLKSVGEPRQPNHAVGVMVSHIGRLNNEIKAKDESRASVYQGGGSGFRGFSWQE